MRSLFAAIVLLAALANPAFSQSPLPGSRSVFRIVTVLSDALSEPAGPASQVLGDLSILMDKESDVRVLAVAGYGGPANVRDLLLLRGTDFAILNNDVFTYLDLTTPIPDARRKIRMVAPLFHQRVLLFVRKDIKTIEGLRGKKVAVPAKHPSRGVTGKVIFGSLKIDAGLVELDEAAFAKSAKDQDAILIYESDLLALANTGVSPATHRLLPLPASGALASTYVTKKLGKADLKAFGAGGMETLQVTEILAAFDWSAKQGRYPDAITFADRVFALAPKFRARNPASPFSKIALGVQIPGWKYFGPAEVLAKAAPAPAAKEEAPLTIPEPLAATPVAPVGEAASHSSDVLRIVAASRPPLLDSQREDGGIVLKILTGALDAAGMHYKIEWAKSEKAMLEDVLSARTPAAGLFAQSPDCDYPSHQSAMEATICDRAALSEPVMQTVIAILTLANAQADPKKPNQAIQSLCVAENQAIPDEAIEDTPWLKADKLKVTRPKSLVDCLAALQMHETSAMFAIEPEVRLAAERLSMTQALQISQRFGATAGLHLAIAKGNPHQAELIRAINDALVRFKATGAYSTAIASHLGDLTGLAAKQP